MGRFALLRKDKQQAGAAPTVSELEAVLAELETESAEAAAAIEKLEARRTEVLLHETDEAAKKHDEHTADLRRRLDRANARIEALRVEIEDRKAEEAERVKREERAAIEKQIAAAQKELAARYPKAAAEIVALLEICAKADVAAEAFNRKLAEDEQPIAPVEKIRSRQAEPERIVSRKVVQKWVYAVSPWSTGGDIVPDEPLRTLRKEGPRTGHVYTPSGHPSEVVLQDFEECEVIPPVGLQRAEPLANTIRLPAFRGGESDLWSPLDSHHPQAVLAALERRATARAAERQAEVVLRPKIGRAHV